ncbi:E3 ubiquitin-protein ligase RNF4 [Pyrus ussuriensis x Pyrus communis]|uniref:E3 ubiquitin-protein ligase RNF4 n=1 Tax=Pyrus ussuriensis x Pyrus communis TaxID=2448454 RepID=A0A5N5F7T5_9ROSA|nr:E3 ubiquitin-protein ligase RNF4 [Pyrus ussuriensis x Pyrus communis]
MSTRGARAPHARGRQRKNELNLDLNSAPPGDSREQEGTSTQSPIPPNTIDVEAIDDDVIESSPTAFAEACLY